MNDIVYPGKEFTTAGGKTIAVQEVLETQNGETICTATYEGEMKILHWVQAAEAELVQARHREIRSQRSSGSPGNAFLWVEDMTECTDDGFGYLTAPIPEGYKPLTDYWLGREQLPDRKTVVTAAMHLVSAFRRLRVSDLIWHDATPDGILLHKETGRVLVPSTNHIVSKKLDMNWQSQVRFAPPEIVKGQPQTDYNGNLYSLSLFLFLLFCQAHPLEGAASSPDALSDEEKTRIYGEEAAFLFDEEHPGTASDAVAARWAALPDYLQKKFRRAFSKDFFADPGLRMREIQWIRDLVRYRSELVPCDCGAIVHVQHGKKSQCPQCGGSPRITLGFRFKEYAVPVFEGLCIYQCQLGNCQTAAALQPIGRVVAMHGDPEKLVLYNLTGKTWIVTKPGGAIARINVDEVLPLVDGLSFKPGALMDGIQIFGDFEQGEDA